MQNLPDVIEHQELRVLSTLQLAEAFQTNNKVVTRNFQRNKERYEEGVHYFALSGDALKRFKTERQDDASLKYVSVYYLWTEKGAWLHAKSLNSDAAWKAYHMLIDSYYEIIQQVQIKASDSVTLALTDADWERVQQRLEVLEMQIQEVTLHSGEQRRLRSAVGERVHQLAKQAGARPALFRALYSALREQYEVESYRDVKQHQLQDALQFVGNWKG